MSYALIIQLADPAASCGAPNPDPASAQLGPGTMLYEYDGGDPGYAAVAGSCGTNTFGAVLPGYTSSYSLAGFPANYLGPNSWIIRNLPGNWSNAAATFRIVGTLDIAPDASNTAYSRPIDIVQPMPVPQFGNTIQTATMPWYLNSSAGAASGNSSYIYGGNIGSGPASTSITLQTWSYNDSTGVWTRKADGPQNVQLLTAAATDTDVYFVGGLLAGGTQTIAIDVYNIASDTHNFLLKSGWPAVQEACAAVIGNVLYTFGGLYVNPGPYFRNWLYAWTLPISNSYTPTLLAAGPLGRRGASLTAIGGNLYMHGGVDTSSGPGLSDLWVYYPSSNSWVQLADCPVGRYHHAGVAHGTDLWIVGGTADQSSYAPVLDLYKYDTVANTWSKGSTSLPFGSDNGQSSWIINNKIMLAGGYNTSDVSWPSLNTMFIID